MWSGEFNFVLYVSTINFYFIRSYNKTVFYKWSVHERKFLLKIIRHGMHVKKNK